MGPYALLHVLEPARAAQYSAMLEGSNLSATPARTIDEALFHVRRLGPPAVILLEVHADTDEFGFLRSLRKAKQTAPALLISGSWKLRNEANRVGKQLGIREVLAPSQPLATVEKAVRRVLGDAPVAAPVPRRKKGGQPSVPPPVGPPSFPPMPLGRALRTPLHRPQESVIETIPQILSRTARSLRASMVILWADDAYGGVLHGHFGWEDDLVPMVGTSDEWAPFRRLAASAPVLVQEAAADKVLAHSPLVASGMVGSFAGAPLVDTSGAHAGVLFIVHTEPHGLVPDVLAPLTVWAQHIGADLPRIPVVAPAPARPVREEQPARAEATLEPTAAMEAAALALEHGLIVTDPSGRVAAANRASVKLLGLRSRRLVGLSRERLIERLRLDNTLDASQAMRLLRGRSAQAIELKLGDPARILRWEMRPITIESQACVVDQISDVTAAREQQVELDRLVRVDALTWLANRTGFRESLGGELARALRFKTPVSLALLSIDGFALLEPPAADPLLRRLGWLIADLKRGFDHAARIAPGTLAIVLPGADAPGALVFAHRVAEEARELKAPGLPHVTLSGGVAQFDVGEDVDALVARALAALQEAEACGGDGIL